MVANIFDPSNLVDNFTGSGKMLVLAFVDDMSETHHNLKVILEHLQIDKCSYILTGDLKVLNLVLGISVNYHNLK